MRIRSLSYLLCFTVLLCLLTGCGKDKEEIKEKAVSKPISYEQLMKQWKEQVHLDTVSCWYTNDTDKIWLEQAAQAFEEKYSAKVNLVYYDGMNFFEDLNQANQEAAGADVYLLGNDQLQLAKNSGMAEENVSFDDTFWETYYPKVAKEAVTYQERQYGYPIYFDTYCLVYDAKLLEEAPASMEEILDFLNTYENPDSTKAVFRWDVADPYVNTMFFASYANLFGEHGDNESEFCVNDKQSVKAMQYFQSLSAYLWMDKNNISHDKIKSRIKDGTLVLGLCKSDILPTLYEMKEKKEETDTDYRVAYVPSLTEKLSSTTLSTTYSAFINPYGKDTALGNMFALFLSYEYVDQQFEGNGKLPVREYRNNLDELQSVIYAQYLNSKPVPKVAVFGDYLVESGIAFDEIWDGEEVKEQLDRLQNTIEEKIN